jgi:hypothetical protein
MSAQIKIDPTSTIQERLMELAWREAEKHKWIESEKAGRDLGEAAIYDWSHKHFRRWCRDRWIEHLAGERYWIELDRADFGLLQRAFHPNAALVQEIVLRIKGGGENLDILNWAMENGKSLYDAMEILRLLDINSRRLSFERPCS